MVCFSGDIIVNLNIPVKYSKESKAVASIRITDTAALQKLNDSKIMVMSDFVNEILNSEYISQYIIPSKYKCNIETVVKINTNNSGDLHYGFEVKDNEKVLNEIGKVNNGNDVITELTLHILDSSVAYKQYSDSKASQKTKFGITSFIMSPEKQTI